MSPRRWLVPVFPVVLFVAAAGGCRSVTTRTVANYQPAQPERPRAAASPAAVQRAPAGHVYVYIISGADPLHLAGTDRLADQFRAAGFPNTRTATWLEERRFEREVRDTRQADPAARFALIGHSAGAYAVKRVAANLVGEGVPVVMVGYVGGDYLRDTPATRLAGVGHVVNVTGNGYLLTGRNLFFNGTDLTGARNVRLAGTRHMDLPAHPDTFAALIGELTAATAVGAAPPTPAAPQ